MRMWDVPPFLLCQKHLLGEHKEMHMAAGNVTKGRSIQGYIDRGQLNPCKITQRHNELVREMLWRNMNHKSPLTLDCSYLPDHPVDLEYNVKDLKERCENCAARIYLYGIPLLKTNRIIHSGKTEMEE